MNVVSFKEYTPTPRYDSVAWHHVNIEEAPAQSGPWTLIDTLVLVPPDADPANPATRDFTTDNATIEEGWYKITFFDASGNDSLPTTPIHHVPDETLPYLPNVDEVGRLVMARTKDRFGVETGTFTSNTRPTFSQARDLIEEAASDVTSLIDTDIPEGAYRYVRQAIALRTAMLIERAYFAEQINSNRSPYPQLNSDYEYLTGKDGEPGLLTRAVEREAQEVETGEAPLLNRPSYSFPEADLRYKLGRPL